MNRWCPILAACMILLVTASAMCQREIPEGVSTRDYYGGFFPTDEWIASLAPAPRGKRENPFQRVRIVDEMPEGKEAWEGPVLLLTEEALTSKKKAAAPYLELKPAELLGLVPRRNRISGNARTMQTGRPYCPTGDGGLLDWRPDEPERIRCSKGHPVDPFELFPPTGCFRIEGPKGDVQEYPYHDAADGKRVFLNGEYMDALRVHYLINAAKDLGQLFLVTDDQAFARRCAAIVYDFACAVPHWPKIHRGRPGVEGKDRFRPVDEYVVYSSIWRDKYHGGLKGGAGDLALAYDFVVNAPVWSELDERAPGGDARNQIEQDLFLYSAKDALRYDVRFPQPYAALSNYIPAQDQGLICIGRGAGIPEVVHYAYWKHRQLANKTLMADSVFPESPSYGRMHVYGMAKACRMAQGYADPPGFTSTVDGSRFEGLDVSRDIPELRRAVETLETMVYPDDSYIMVHDTWSKLVSSGHLAPAETHPLIYPAFGHACLARGERPKRNQIQAHLHYSGNLGHDHLDMLSFVLWPYAEELISDIGYAHTYRMFSNNTSSHNLVVVDRKVQDSVAERGNLIGWHPVEGEVQVVEVSAPRVYPQCRTYRRTLYLIPLGETDNVVVDIFEVEGGTIHEWMAQGSCLAEQTIEVSLPMEFFADSYADDGKPFTPPDHREWEKQLFRQGMKPTQLENDAWYGVFRNVFKGSATGPFKATFRSVDRTLPDVRLHMVELLPADVYTCSVPSLRRCWSDAMGAEDHTFVEKYRMPKLVIRREGADLRSRFVAVWEPIHGHDLVAVVKSLATGDAGSVALEIRTTGAVGDQTIHVFYSADPSRPTVVNGTTRFQGRYATVVSGCAGRRVTLFECSHFSLGELDVAIPRRRSLPVHSVAALADDRYAVRLQGKWDDAPGRDARVFPEPELFILTQDRDHHRAFPVCALRSDGNMTILECTRHPGFEYDARRQVLKEVFTPFLETAGVATVAFPTRVWLSKGADDSDAWQVRSADTVLLQRNSRNPIPRGVPRYRKA